MCIRDSAGRGCRGEVARRCPRHPRRQQPGVVPAGMAQVGRPGGYAVTSAAKQHTLELAERYVCPDRVRVMSGAGIDLVMGKREGYRIWDVDGRALIDIHLNGGVYNLGHRNPDVIAALAQALQTLDIGNHHFPSTERAEPVSYTHLTLPTILR